MYKWPRSNKYCILIWAFEGDLSQGRARELLRSMVTGRVARELWSFEPWTLVSILHRENHFVLLTKIISKLIKTSRKGVHYCISVVGSLIEATGWQRPLRQNLQKMLDHLDITFGIPEHFIQRFLADNHSLNTIDLRTELCNLSEAWREHWGNSVDRHCAICNIDLSSLTPICSRLSVVKRMTCCFATVCDPCLRSFTHDFSSIHEQKRCNKCSSIHMLPETKQVQPNALLETDLNEWRHGVLANQYMCSNNYSPFENTVLTGNTTASLTLGSKEHLQALIEGRVSYLPYDPSPKQLWEF